MPTNNIITMMKLNTIRCCDCMEGMKEIPDKSIDLVITDPPYGLGSRVVEGGSVSPLIWTSFDSPSRIWVKNIVDVTMDGRVHPTQKPVKLFEWIIKNYAKEGDTICDPFAGSGSTGMAAQHEGVNSILIDIDQHYCDIARARNLL